VRRALLALASRRSSGVSWRFSMGTSIAKRRGSTVYSATFSGGTTEFVEENTHETAFVSYGRGAARAIFTYGTESTRESLGRQGQARIPGYIGKYREFHVEHGIRGWLQGGQVGPPVHGGGDQFVGKRGNDRRGLRRGLGAT
jgi:hypothetical protein